MNNMTLAQLKRNVRHQMNTSYPGGIGTVLKGALLYLLLTNWVVRLLFLVQENPLSTLFTQVTDAMASGSSAVLNGVLHLAQRC